MLAEMSVESGKPAVVRAGYIAEAVEITTDRLAERQVVDTRKQVSDWLSLAASEQESETLRIAALSVGIRGTLYALGEALCRHRDDSKVTAIADNFAEKAKGAAARMLLVTPPAEDTMNALLDIAEGVGQASTSVRAAAFTTYVMGRQQYCKMADYVENTEQSARAQMLQRQFPHAQESHARFLGLSQ